MPEATVKSTPRIQAATAITVSTASSALKNFIKSSKRMVYIHILFLSYGIINICGMARPIYFPFYLDILFVIRYTNPNKNRFETSFPHGKNLYPKAV